MEEENTQDNPEETPQTDDRREKFQRIFNIFDKDGNGEIDRDELATGLRALGCNPTDEDIQTMIAEADSKVNPNGKLEFSEFCEVIEQHYKDAEEVEADLLRAFMTFDKNGDGIIDKGELREALKTYGFDKLTDADIDELFVEADVDDDGKIKYNELVRVMCKT